MFVLHNGGNKLGVTLWEIMSYAARPYYGLQPQDVIAYVEAGKCLAKPDSCPDAVYKIMQSCWKFDPHERITFEELSQKLGYVCWRPRIGDGMVYRDVVDRSNMLMLQLRVGDRVEWQVR